MKFDYSEEEFGLDYGHLPAQHEEPNRVPKHDRNSLVVVGVLEVVADLVNVRSVMQKSSHQPLRGVPEGGHIPNELDEPVGSRPKVDEVATSETEHHGEHLGGLEA